MIVAQIDYEGRPGVPCWIWWLAANIVVMALIWLLFKVKQPEVADAVFIGACFAIVGFLSFWFYVGRPLMRLLVFPALLLVCGGVFLVNVRRFYFCSDFGLWLITAVIVVAEIGCGIAIHWLTDKVRFSVGGVSEKYIVWLGMPILFLVGSTICVVFCRILLIEFVDHRVYHQLAIMLGVTVGTNFVLGAWALFKNRTVVHLALFLVCQLAFVFVNFQYCFANTFKELWSMVVGYVGLQVFALMFCLRFDGYIIVRHGER